MNRTVSSFFLVLAFLVGLVLTTGTAVVSASSNNWEAAYWNNSTLTGTPILQRTEAEINYDWGDGRPEATVNNDQFSARWTRTINVPAGSYRFTATMDDGMRVWLDNTLIISAWADSQVRTVTQDVYINAGDHQLKVEYYDAGGKAVAKLIYAPTSGNAPVPVSNWKGEYFNNMTLSGTPALVRDDVKVSFDWGIGSPAWNTISSDNFSARWTRNITVEEGRYRFFVTADDGVRLWVNGRLVVDQWHEAGLITYTVEVDLPSGSVPVTMEYFENVGGAVARLDWIKMGNNRLWRGEYFNNITLSGSPVLVRDEAQVYFNWGSSAPATAVNADNFSARFTRTFNLTSGRYRFTVVSDDGVRVWVNGQLIINDWSDHKPQTTSADIDLPSGNIPVVIEYYDAVGGAQIHFSWTTVAVAPVQPPVSSATTGTVVSERLNIRTAPRISNNIVAVLTKGQTVTLAGYRSLDGNWVMIRHNNGTAWVSARPAYLQTNAAINNLPVWQESSQAPGQTPIVGSTAVVANAYYVNMRSGPGVSNSIITVLPSGKQVQMIGRNSNSSWIQIRLDTGRTGWMNGNYLAQHAAYTTLPITD